MRLNKQAKLVFDFFYNKVNELQHDKNVLEEKLINKSLELEMSKATYEGFIKGLTKKKRKV